MPSPPCMSAAGGGIFTASSAARDGMTAKAAIASAPMAAAPSAKRLNGLLRMVCPRGSGVGANLKPAAAASQSLLPPLDTARYGSRYGLLRERGHDCVNIWRAAKGLRA